jgi:hypothetical protein
MTSISALRVALLAAVVVFAIATPNTSEAQRDRGVNQPGAVGNRGGVDPGINQPGAVGNRSAAAVAVATPVGYGGSARQARVVRDPGLNQPGAVGNVGRDPGVNQRGAAGNRR